MELIGPQEVRQLPFSCFLILGRLLYSYTVLDRIMKYCWVYWRLEVVRYNRVDGQHRDLRRNSHTPHAGNTLKQIDPGAIAISICEGPCPPAHPYRQTAPSPTRRTVAQAPLEWDPQVPEPMCQKSRATERSPHLGRDGGSNGTCVEY